MEHYSGEEKGVVLMAPEGVVCFGSGGVGIECLIDENFTPACDEFYATELGDEYLRGLS